jgi:hypothetical protein
MGATPGRPKVASNKNIIRNNRQQATFKALPDDRTIIIIMEARMKHPVCTMMVFVWWSATMQHDRDDDHGRDGGYVRTQYPRSATDRMIHYLIRYESFWRNYIDMPRLLVCNDCIDLVQPCRGKTDGCYQNRSAAAEQCAMASGFGRPCSCVPGISITHQSKICRFSSDGTRHFFRPYHHLSSLSGLGAKA